MHAPAGKVLHGRLANQVDETFGEHGTRHPDLLGQLVDCPRTMRQRVKQPQNAPDLGILQAGEPAIVALCRVSKLPPQHFDEQRLRQPGQDGTVARTGHIGFADQIAQRSVPPLRFPMVLDRVRPPPRGIKRLERQGAVARPDAQQSRQRLQQRIELLIRLQIAADEAGAVAATAVLQAP